MEPNDVDIEFRELAQIDEGDSGFPQNFDCMHPMPQFCAATDDLGKMFLGGAQELQKLNRSRMDDPNQNLQPEGKPEEQSCEEFFGVCEKRASDPHKIKLTKRLVDGELLIEGFDHNGSCVYTRVVEAGAEISEGEPLAKAAITSSMQKTLAQFRASLLPEEVAAAEKAIAALDLPAFLQIIDRAKSAA